MSTITQGWAYVSGSRFVAKGGVGSIQFQNDAGEFSGSSLLVTDQSGSLTGSLISASYFYGDGSGLTGLTASAVAVADGPEMSVQFRYDSPIGREISGSSDLMWITGSTDFLQVTGAVRVAGDISASGDAYVGNNLFVSNNTSQLFGGLDLNSVGITATGPIADATTVSGTYAQFTAVTASAIVGGSPLLISSSATTVTGSLAVTGSLTVSGASDTGLMVNSTLNGGASIASIGDILAGNAGPGNYAAGVFASGEVSGSGDTYVGNNLFVSNNTSQLWGGLDLNSVGISATGPIADATTVSGTYAQFTAVTASAIVGGSPLLISSSATISLSASAITLGTSCSDVVTVNAQLSASCGLSSSFIILDPTSGSLAGAGSYLGLDANNKVIVTSSAGGGGTPGGSDTQVQFNDGGSTFGGDSGLVFNKTTDTLTAVTITASAGINPQGPGSMSIQIGAPAGPTSTRSIVIGDNAAALASADIAIGANTRASKGSGIIVGQDSVITGSAAASAAIIIGYNSTVSSSAGASNAIVIGQRATASAVNAIALGSGSINTTANSMTIGSPSQGMDFNVTGNITLLNNGAAGYGHLNVCQGTASILHLSGCSPIQVHAPMSSSYYAQFTTVSASNIVGNSPLSISSSATTVTGPLAVSDLDEGGILFAGTDGELNTDVDSLQWGTDREENDGYIALFVSSSASGSAALGDGMFMLSDATDEDICLIDAEGAEFAVDVNVDADLSGSGDVNVGNNLFVYNNSAQLWGGLDLNSVGISAAGPIVGVTTLSASALHVSGSDESLFKVDGNEAGPIILNVTGAAGVGVNIDTPIVSFEAHYTGTLNPVNLDDNTGGGEVVYFGSGSAVLLPGALYYLNTDGGWQSVNAATTGSGHNQLLGISLGTQPASDGMLLHGYFDMATYYSGSFTVGGPMYIQSSSVERTHTEGGFISGAAPSAADSYVRVVGYGTDTANVIYFNPDSTYVEIGQ